MFDQIALRGWGPRDYFLLPVCGGEVGGGGGGLRRGPSGSHFSAAPRDPLHRDGQGRHVEASDPSVTQYLQKLFFESACQGVCFLKTGMVV